jgi:outer membrane biosynthesis protein TonB
VGRPRALSAVFVLAAAALAALVAGCGGSSANLLPGKTADQINSNLDQVQALVDEEDCAGAENAVAEVKSEVDELGGVDKKLKAALVQGTERLGEVVDSCGEKALAEAEEEAEQEAEKQAAEQEEQAAVEAEEEKELATEQAKEDKAQEKAEKKSDKEAEKEAPTEPTEEEVEAPAGKDEGAEKGKGPPEVTPGGAEPPAGGVGPGSQVE